MIKTYISALSVLLLVSAQQLVHADTSTDEILSRMDQADQSAAPSSEAESSEQDSRMINSLYQQGITQFKAGSYNEALSIFDAVLSLDKYHHGAVAYKKRAAKQVAAKASKQQTASRAQAIAEVKSAWNTAPKVFGSAEVLTDAKEMGSDLQAVKRMEARLKAITIPVLDVAEATIEEVVQFFAETTRNPIYAAEDVDILLVGMEEAVAENNITISINDISLYEALQYVVESASLKFEINGDLVIIMPANYVPASRMVMKSYDIIPEVGSDLQSAADSSGPVDLFGSSSSGGSAAGPVDVSGFFSIVDFPEGSSAVYQPRFHKLFVRNTPVNLKAVDSVLGDLAEQAIKRRSQQVEIETKFVEFNEGALDELGFDWTVYGNGTVAGMEMKDGTYYQGANGYPTQNGSVVGPLSDAGTLYNDPVSGQQEIISPDRRAQNFFGSNMRNNESAYNAVDTGLLATMGGAPAEMAFTDGNVDLRITAMAQAGTADVLSAPRVTTKSGSEALIRVAETHRYPQDFDVETGQRTSPIVRPVDWSDFDMGVSLKVTPVVNDESNTIDLELLPEIMLFKGYDEYVTGYNAYDSGGNNSVAPGGDGSPLFVTMASFERRNVQTQVSIADGHTVVLGGLVDEQTETFRDQVPFIGDIPYIGRLFRSEGTRNIKKNLTIFVKASRVDTHGMTSADRELAQQ